MGTTRHAHRAAAVLVCCLTVAAARSAEPTGRPQPRKTPIEELRGEVAELRKQVEELKQELATVREQLAAATSGGNGRQLKGDAPAVTRAEIEAAMKKNHFVVGMTKADADKVIARAKVSLNDQTRSTVLVGGRKVEREDWMLNANQQNISKLVFVNGTLTAIDAGPGAD